MSNGGAQGVAQRPNNMVQGGVTPMTRGPLGSAINNVNQATAAGKGGAEQAEQRPNNLTPRAPNINQTAAAGINNAIVGARREMDYRPTKITASGYEADRLGASPTVAAQNVTANQLANTDLSAYVNPYENTVVNNTLSDLDRARQLQQQSSGANATAAGAFGGSRHALREAEDNRNFYDQAAKTAATLRQAGFNNAQQMGLTDIGNTLRADLANQSTNLQADSLTANLAQQTAMANQAAANQAALFNAQQAQAAQMANQNAGLAGSQQRLSAGNQLGNLSNLGFGMGQTLTSNLAQDGAMKQGLNQLLIDGAKKQFEGYTSSPYQSIGLLSQAIGASPVPQTTTTSKQPGLFDYLTLGAGMM